MITCALRRGRNTFQKVIFCKELEYCPQSVRFLASEPNHAIYWHAKFSKSLDHFET